MVLPLSSNTQNGLDGPHFLSVRSCGLVFVGKLLRIRKVDQAYYEQVARQEEWLYELEQRKRIDALDVKRAMEENDERLQETE